MVKINVRVGKVCQTFRHKHLGITLKQMGLIGGVTDKTLSLFETGRSTNINHLDAYLKVCTPELKTILFNEIINAMAGE